jgi:Cys-tRNA(Pro)/Cys-tRNA(Cys) deacylase
MCYGKERENSYLHKQQQYTSRYLSLFPRNCAKTKIKRSLPMDLVQSVLENSNYDYEFIFHEKQIYSAAEGADFFGIEPGQTAPTLIVKAETGYFSIIFSGSRGHIDFERIAKLLNVSQVKLASKDKVVKITGFNPGDTPMVGLALPAVFDRKLLQYPFVYGGSGQPNRTLKIAPVTLTKLNRVVAFLDSD